MAGALDRAEELLGVSRDAFDPTLTSVALAVLGARNIARISTGQPMRICAMSVDNSSAVGRPS